MSASGKTNLITPIIILLALAAIAFLTLRPKPAPDSASQTADASHGMLVDLAADAINRLDVHTPTGTDYSLLKQDDSWFALRDGKQYPADTARVDKLLADLPDLQSEALVSEKAEQHGTFELNEDQAYSLAVYGGGSDPSLTLLVGKSTPNVKGCYVRFVGEDKVYKASANLRTSLGFSFEDFRSKQLWGYDPALADSVTVRQVDETGLLTGEPQKFNRKDGLWVLDTDGSNGNQNDLQELVDKFSGLRIQSYIDDPASLPIEQYDPAKSATPCLTVTSGGKNHTLTICGNEEGNIVVADQDGMVYKTSKSNLGFLLDLDFAKLSFYEEPAAEDAAADAGAEAGLPEGVGSDAAPAEPVTK
jgi:hypothetical protein